MKINWNLIMTILFGIFISVVIFFGLFSCNANYHFTKFIQKGGKIDTNERIIEVSKTIKVNGKDSLIVLKVPSVCPEVKIPPTRFEKRIEYRLKRDTMRLIKFQTKWKVKEIVKTKRVERSDWWKFWLGLFSGLGGCVLTHFVIKKLNI
jgi:hypothetical protein